MENRIVLTGCQRNFKNSSHKKGHYRATATSLRLQVRYVWHRHIVREFEGIIPVQIVVHGPSAEAVRFIFFYVFVDFLCAAQKFYFFLKKVAIMIQIMDIQFKPASSNLADKTLRHFIALLRHNLE